MKRLLWLCLLLCGCVKVPKGIEPVAAFELNRYLGTWYEIARLDHPFERGLDQVSAEYSLRDDGGVRVLNRGKSSNGWKTAEGKAYFAQNPKIGFLKVSFFGPFFASYVIFDLSPDYRTAYVCGPNRTYLWLLARTPTLPPEEIARFIRRSEALGFNTDALIFPEQTPPQKTENRLFRRCRRRDPGRVRRRPSGPRRTESDTSS
jgi:apolipoprotein D and lipocalin family protein